MDEAEITRYLDLGHENARIMELAANLAIRELIEPKAGDRNQVAPGWKSALNALTLYFEDRITIR